MNPLVNALVLFFVFRTIFEVRSLGEVDFFPYVYSGVILVLFFTQTVSQASEQVAGAIEILRRAKIPAEVFILSKIFTNLIHFAFALIPLLLYFLMTKQTMTWGMLIAPLIVIPLVLCIFCISTLLSIAYVLFRDLQFIVPTLLTLSIYLTPVFYSIDMLGNQTQQILELNPLVWLLDSFRFHLGLNGIPHYSLLCLLTIFGFVTSIMALRLFERNRMRITFSS